MWNCLNECSRLELKPVRAKIKNKTHQETKALNSLKTRPVVKVKQFDLNNDTLEKLYEQDKIDVTTTTEKTLFDNKNLNVN